jgi:hypothetical protein
VRFNSFLWLRLFVYKKLLAMKKSRVLGRNVFSPFSLSQSVNKTFMLHIFSRREKNEPDKEEKLRISSLVDQNVTA